MGDTSQSRYSIVERLTQTKLEIISAKSQLEGDITSKKQAIEEAKNNLKDWEANVGAEKERMKREFQRTIGKAEIDAKNAEQRKKIKEQTFDEKIKAIDKALEQIQKISETAPPAS